MKTLKVLLTAILVMTTGTLIAAEPTEEEKLLAVQRIDIIDKPALMIGMGLTQRMSDDYYIAALYLEENVQFDGTDVFLYEPVVRRMEFRIASTSSVSARSFARKLAEGIRINNARDDISLQKAQVARLMRFFRGTYKKGDVLRFDYHNSFGTRVSLNDRVLGEIPRSNDMYKLLIKVWVGERPPSSRFKEGIMGKNEPEYAVNLLKKFVAL
ncbi:hypothetical protein FLL45_03235 [Aliikangiella marina]|uniref:Chalcone isomerase domain-containing protein n=1 Tax=Aliikangiella marina TaxID=1712262 RepID=A0A545TID1_9GAMM|nr:chalcone isomerase family protein [Aliikangiella marina]TQV76980.1 hypothetical protein FLL45_03235 [Aliikangiella marina]